MNRIPLSVRAETFGWPNVAEDLKSLSYSTISSGNLDRSVLKMITRIPLNTMKNILHDLVNVAPKDSSRHTLDEDFFQSVLQHSVGVAVVVGVLAQLREVSERPVEGPATGG